MDYLPRLDSLRFLAAFSVIACHCGHIIPFGWMGVPFFFVLSGFLITGILVRLRDNSGHWVQALGVFFVRRALRIMPLYYAFALALTIYFIVTHYPASFPGVAPYLYTYTLNFAQISPNYVESLTYDPLWSLAVEWQFYLVWPFMIFLVPARWTFAFLLASVAAAPLLRGLAQLVMERHHFSAAAMGNTIHGLTWTYLDAFALGGLLNWRQPRTFFQNPRTFYACLALFVLGGVISLGLDRLHGAMDTDDLGYGLIHHGQAVWGYTMLDLFMTSVLAATFGGGEWLINRLTDLSLLRELGKISYGIYVYHGPVVAAATYCFPFIREHAHSDWERLAKILIFFAAVAITSGWAYLSFYYMEAFFLSLKPKRRVRPPSQLASGS